MFFSLHETVISEQQTKEELVDEAFVIKHPMNNFMMIVVTKETTRQTTSSSSSSPSSSSLSGNNKLLNGIHDRILNNCFHNKLSLMPES